MSELIKISGGPGCPEGSWTFENQTDWKINLLISSSKASHSLSPLASSVGGVCDSRGQEFKSQVGCTDYLKIKEKNL